MDVEKYRRNVEERLKVDRLMREVGKELQEYDDRRQDLRIERAEIFQPITSEVKEVKKTIDDRQDKLLEKLTENQNALAAAVVNSAPSLPPPPTPPRYRADIDKNFSPEEMVRLIDYQLPAPSDVMKAVMDNELNWKEYDIRLGKQLQELGRKKGQLSKSKRAKEKNALAIEGLTSDIKLLQKYRNRIKLLDEGQPLLSPTFTGTGVRKYRQSKRNAYKIDTGGQYGGLMINVPRLLNEMVVEAVKGGSIIYEQPVDRSLVDLLPKKYNPNTNYSLKAIQIFQDLSKLANMPKHRSSGKSKLLKSGGQIYYTSPEDLMNRLTLLTGTRAAGNTNIELRNEIWEILDHLLKNEKISKKQYDTYIQKNLQ